MSFFKPHQTPRLLLFFSVILVKIIASVLAAIGFVLNNAAFMITGTVAWLVFFALLLMVAVPEADNFLKKYTNFLRRTALIVVIVMLAVTLTLTIIIVTIGLSSIEEDNPEGIWSQLFVSLDNIFCYNDATALSHQAAANFLDGKNPYAEANVVTAMIDYNGSKDKITPLREGEMAEVFPYPSADQLEQLWEDVSVTPEVIPPEIESRFNYPAGCFLIPAFFIWLGIDDLRIIYLILIIPALAYVIWRVKPDMRILMVGAIIISVELWYSLAAGETGYIYFPFVLMAWVLHKRNLWASLLFMAVAVAVKQWAWFLLPFYLILVYRTVSAKTALAAISIIVVVFLATNAWFIADDAGLWIRSVLAPVTDNMFPIGVGIISLVSGGVIDVQSSLPFSIIEIVLLVSAVAWYFFYCRRYPYTALAQAVLPLFFAWRSLWGYFFYIDIILFAAVLINEYGTKTDDEPETGDVKIETPDTA